MSHALFIVIVPNISISWWHVAYVKEDHNSIQGTYCAIHVKQINITISQGFFGWFWNCIVQLKQVLLNVLKDFIPVNHFDDRDFIKCIEEISQYSDILVRLQNDTKIFYLFDINEDDSDIIRYHEDINPDKCYFIEYSYKLSINCNHYTDDYFNKYSSRHSISDNSFSVAHLNARSIPAIFSLSLSYWNNLDHCFIVIGLSETWLNPINVSAYGISGYNHVHRTRCSRKGGGVSLFVPVKFEYSEMADHCIVNDYIGSLFVKNNQWWYPGYFHHPLEFRWTCFIFFKLSCCCLPRMTITDIKTETYQR